MLAIYAPGPFRRVANLNGIWIECIILYELPSEAKNKWLTEEKNIFFDIKNTYLLTPLPPKQDRSFCGINDIGRNSNIVEYLQSFYCIVT